MKRYLGLGMTAVLFAAGCGNGGGSTGAGGAGSTSNGAGASGSVSASGSTSGSVSGSTSGSASSSSGSGTSSSSGGGGAVTAAELLAKGGGLQDADRNRARDRLRRQQVCPGLHPQRRGVVAGGHGPPLRPKADRP